VAVVVKEDYPQYRVWKDHVLGCYEVARWDNENIAVIVQTNILTREKAEAARDEWQQREKEK
jgi:hypothetical protein